LRYKWDCVLLMHEASSNPVVKSPPSNLSLSSRSISGVVDDLFGELVKETFFEPGDLGERENQEKLI